MRGAAARLTGRDVLMELCRLVDKAFAVAVVSVLKRLANEGVL